MEILWINLGVVYISSFFARFFSKPILGIAPYVKPNKLFVFLVAFALIVVSGLRNNIGDTYFYMHSYQVGDFKLKDIKLKGDFGFNIYQSFLHRISNDPQILIFVTALITNLLIVLVLYKYSRMFELSLYVYITAGMYVVSMNGIRQYMAASIVFVATKYILKGNFKKFLFIVLFASIIHQTALIFIPTYFIVRSKAWTKITFLILLLGVLIAAGFGEFSNILFSALDDTQYGHYSDYAAKGANLLRPVVTSVPLIIAFLGRDKLRKLWPESDYIVNLSLLGLVFMIISTKNWLFARFDIYFGLYNLILISWIIQLFVNKQRKILYFLLVVCYFFYFYYEQVISLQLQYGSHYLTW